MRVLFIEDNENVRRTLLGVLRRTLPGATFDTAESADEAIERLKDSACTGPSYDLVISDYNLVGVCTGGDVLTWIQEHLSYLVSRFVFLTSQTDAVRDRGVPYFDKPFDVSAFKQTLIKITQPEASNQ